MVCSEYKKKLIEEIGLHFELTHQISPLAARIYAIMILSPYDGHTFDEILEITQASKSSVSTQLNLLVQLKKVEYFTKPGDRKRYLVNTLEEHVQTINQEIKMVNKIAEFNAEFNKHKYEEHGQFSILFKEYLINQKKNMMDTIEKMSKLTEK